MVRLLRRISTSEKCTQPFGSRQCQFPGSGLKDRVLLLRQPRLGNHSLRTSRHKYNARHGLLAAQKLCSVTRGAKELVLEDAQPKHLRIGTMKVEIYPDRKAAGVAAAKAAAGILIQLGQAHESFSAIFATGASQLDTLDALTGIENLPWNQITGFHMDEYVGIDADHPASFRRYMRERLVSKIHLKEFFEIDGDASDPEQVARDYAGKLRSADPKLCLLGIGENGHLAFNDPPVAKIVRLDAECRQQQTAEGWFASVDQVPEYAITLTIPALMRVPKLIVSVPGPRKANIVRRAFEEPISTNCPATILRNHPDVTIYLDVQSADQLHSATYPDEI
jgi:glucosamine-6-phosphate deaminase